MPIDHDNKYIFIHIPKTAGTSIENFLDLCHPKNHLEGKVQFIESGVNYNYQHLTAYIYKTYGFLRSEDFKTYFKFAFVRNPYDRCVSEFFFNKDGFKKRGIPRLIDTDFSPEAFSKFLFKLVNKTYLFTERHLPQSHFILDKNENILVDFIGKYENLKEDLSKVLNILKINKCINKFPHKFKNLISYDKSEYLTPKNKELIYYKFEKDFEIFQYKK